MRRVTRCALPASTTQALEGLQQGVNGSDDCVCAARNRWKHKETSAAGRAAFAAIRGALKTMARGRCRCMYCEDNQGTDIEHYRPKALYPEAAFSWDNLLLACSHCNSNEKRSEFPCDATGAPLLLDPSTDVPEEHLDFVPDTGHFVARSEKAKETIRVLGLNARETLTQGRQDAWVTFCALVSEYGKAKALGEQQRASQLLGVIERESFASVFGCLARMASGAQLVNAGEEAVAAAINSCPELRALVDG